ncbi:hypothetical protein Rhow_008544 [Rhodococcus wratislaviensis]|uniref:Uncharacterized protein n=2 Tax=Rhodococcus wratislaviensis TaxID=44752 RepID=A0A402CKR3_RHOWR|nr:hypothetical protein Rhow_008544 [Rhodococcus wratislaviensis]
MYSDTKSQPRPERVVPLSTRSQRPDRDELFGAEAVELDVESLDRYAHTALGVRALFESARHPTPPLLIRINTCLASTTREAMLKFERSVGRGSDAHRNHVWFVGTKPGLDGLIKDLRSLQLGDGVSCIPVETAGLRG